MPNLPLPLPLVEVEVREPDPDWAPNWVVGKQGIRVATNHDDSCKLLKVEAEVVQLNLNKETMRIRYKSPLDGRWRTPDVSIAPFFAKYHIAHNQDWSVVQPGS